MRSGGTSRNAAWLKCGALRQNVEWVHMIMVCFLKGFLFTGYVIWLIRLRVISCVWIPIRVDSCPAQHYISTVT